MRTLLVSIFLTSTLALPAFAEPAKCVQTGQLMLGFDNTEMWVDVSKGASLAAAEQDFKGFCEWNRMDRAAGVLSRQSGPKAPETRTQYRVDKYEGDRDEAASTLLSRDLSWGLSPWESSMMGHPRLKEMSGRGTFFSEACLVKQGCHAQLLKQFRRDDLKAHYEVPNYKTRGPLKVSSAELMGACGFLSPLETLSCASAGRQLMKWVEVHTQQDDTQVTAVPLLRETLADQKLTPVLQKVVVKLYERFESGQMPKDASVYSDLTSEFQNAGFSREESHSQALRVLGAISSGGPNFAMRINRSEITGFPSSCEERSGCNLNGVLMQALAEGMSHADTLMMKAGHPSVYSLPPGAGFPCDIGKSYHFWATAAWTDRLMADGFSASSARTAVYASHLGYHLRADTDERTNNVLAMPRYGAVENGLRLDMNLASAGAAFAARAKTPSAAEPLNIQEGFLKTLRDGNLSPANPESSFQRSPTQVYEWTQRVSAKTAFDAY